MRDRGQYRMGRGAPYTRSSGHRICVHNDDNAKTFNGQVWSCDAQ